MMSETPQDEIHVLVTVLASASQACRIDAKRLSDGKTLTEIHRYIDGVGDAIALVALKLCAPEERQYAIRPEPPSARTHGDDIDPLVSLAYITAVVQYKVIVRHRPAVEVVYE
jgi:hypothetical protein